MAKSHYRRTWEKGNIVTTILGKYNLSYRHLKTLLIFLNSFLRIEISLILKSSLCPFSLRSLFTPHSTLCQERCCTYARKSVELVNGFCFFEENKEQINIYKFILGVWTNPFSSQYLESLWLQVKSHYTVPLTWCNPHSTSANRNRPLFNAVT